jgi:hypothetical protein
MNQDADVVAKVTITTTIRIPIGALLPLKTADGRDAQLRVHHVDRGRVILVPHPEGAFVLEPTQETT